jgi:hypothetical protein
MYRIFKLSVLAFYCRFLPRKPYRRLIYATMIVSVLFGIAIALVSDAFILRVTLSRSTARAFLNPLTLANRELSRL